MGNTGKPSKGCILCVKRRIKCDETNPQCFRCEIVGQECPGYLNPDDWVFKSENDRARRKALRLSKQDYPVSVMIRAKVPTKPTKTSQQCAQGKISATYADGSPTSSLSESACTTGAGTDAPDHADQIAILPGLVASQEFRSVCLFLDTLTQPVSSSCDDPSYLDFLPEMFIASSPQSCLRGAVVAVAQANFLNRYGAHSISKVTAQAYVKALALTNQALADPKLAVTDETLASVQCLGLFELISYPSTPQPDRPGAWASHIAGITELLRMRGRSQLSTLRGRQLFRAANTPMLIRAIMFGYDTPQESIDLVRAIQEDHVDPSNGAAMVSVFFQEVISVRAKIIRLIKQHTLGLDRGEFIQTMEQLIEDGMAVDNSFSYNNWAFDYPHWQPKHNPASTLSCSSDCPTNWYYFSSIWVLGHWSTYWTARIYLYRSFLEGVNAIKSARSRLSASPLEAQRKNFESTLQSCADEIIASIDYAFGFLDSRGLPLPINSSSFASSVGILRLFWPLGVLFSSPYTTAEQKAVTRKALNKIGLEYGIAKALWYTHCLPSSLCALLYE